MKSREVKGKGEAVKIIEAAIKSYKEKFGSI